MEGHSRPDAWARRLARKGNGLGRSAAQGAGELEIFELGEAFIALLASNDEGAMFVIGLAVPHPPALVMGNDSVHTSNVALQAGEHRIADLARQLKDAGDLRRLPDTIPLYE
jgi:hypothetical protein